MRCWGAQVGNEVRSQDGGALSSSLVESSRCLRGWTVVVEDPDPLVVVGVVGICLLRRMPRVRLANDFAEYGRMLTVVEMRIR